jgi:hypothetical protein
VKATALRSSAARHWAASSRSAMMKVGLGAGQDPFLERFAI